MAQSAAVVVLVALLPLPLPLLPVVVERPLFSFLLETRGRPMAHCASAGGLGRLGDTPFDPVGWVSGIAAGRDFSSIGSELSLACPALRPTRRT